MGKPSLTDKIVQRSRFGGRREPFDDQQFDFHSLREHRLQEDRDAVPFAQVGPWLCEPRQVGGQLDKGTVVFQAANGSSTVIPGAKSLAFSAHVPNSSR